MKFVQTKSIVSKGLCRQCGGSGARLRPIKNKDGVVIKLLNFVRCSSCAGHGVRRSMSVCN